MSGFARRDKYVVAIANFVLRFASRRYRAIVKGAIIHGFKAAAEEDSTNG